MNVRLILGAPYKGEKMDETMAWVILFLLAIWAGAVIAEMIMRDK